MLLEPIHTGVLECSLLISIGLAMGSCVSTHLRIALSSPVSATSNTWASEIVAAISADYGNLHITQSQTSVHSRVMHHICRDCIVA